MQTSKSWTADFSLAYKNLNDLYRFLEWEMTDELHTVAKTYPIFIPVDLAHKIKKLGSDSALAREFLPDISELSEMGLMDPIGDKTYHKAPQLIHRYASRALFTPTSVCPVHCRYCFRKNELNQKDELFDADFEKTIDYLKHHPEISEIIFTGGDPLTLSNDKIEKYLHAFSEIETIRDIRFHTRYPVILPERLDQGFMNLMAFFAQSFRTISIAIHANHIDEFDPSSIKKILELSETPVQLLSQTVLLKGVNDNVSELVSLFQLFMELKIRPYYLHHPDQVRGGMHFYLPLETGRAIYATLKSKLPGWAIPQYVIDIPGGHGKVNAFNPETFSFSGTLLNQHGQAVPMKEVELFN